MLPRTATRFIHSVNPTRSTVCSVALLHSTCTTAAPPPRASSSSSSSSPRSTLSSNRRTARSPSSSEVQRQPRNKPLPTQAPSTKTELRLHFRQNGQPYDDSYLLCDQLKLLSSRDQLDKAIDLVRRTPAPACTIVVWNVLINEVLHVHGDAAKAYELWMEMKRRAFVPTTRSFATFFRGLASIAIKAKGRTGAPKTKATLLSSTTLSRARTIHTQWVTHVAKALESDKMTLEHDSDQLSVLPTNHYLTFLGHTDQVELMLETFNSLPASGPLAPNSATYSLVLGFLKAVPSSEHFKLSIEIFNRMLEALPCSQMDNRTLSIILSICRDQVRPDDQALGISIATQVFGLLPLGETHRLVDPTTPKPLLRMDQTAFSSVLTLLLKMQRYNLAVEWFDQVRDHGERFGTEVIAKEQCELVLQAWVAKRGDAGAEALLEWMLAQGIEPTMNCYALTIKACWKNVNISRAYHVLSRMTGHRLPPKKATPTTPSGSSSTMSTSVPSPEPRLVRYSSKRLRPSARALTYFLHTALSTRDRAHLSEALSTFLTPLNEGGLEGRSYLFDSDSDSEENTKVRTKSMGIIEERYFRFTLHRVLERCLVKVLDVPREVMGRYLTAAKVEEWKGVWGEVREWIGRNKYKNEEGVEGEGVGEQEESMERRYEALKENNGKQRRQSGGTQPWEGRGRQTLSGKSGEGKREKRRMGFEHF
ncbi:BQ2448_3843 [Microbotryum intermedium]|uniref:BQ2448_3843 protein n=1 Tax=Microbotryum intermedium TaxID=269621 RepID=A0A238FMJ8_9BASI|nr:BQ2448_3843 [Microbotryum intermedium]